MKRAGYHLPGPVVRARKTNTRDSGPQKRARNERTRIVAVDVGADTGRLAQRAVVRNGWARERRGKEREREREKKEGRGEREKFNTCRPPLRVSSFLFFCLEPKAPRTSKRCTRVTPQVFVSFSSHSPHHLTLRARSRVARNCCRSVEGRGEYLRWVKSTVSSPFLSFSLSLLFLIFSYNGLEARREGGSCRVASALNDSVERKRNRRICACPLPR